MRNQIILELESWLDTKWQHQGRIKKNQTFNGGVDCVGLIACINKKFNKNCIDYTNYKRTPTKNDLIYIFKEKMQEIKNDEIEDGDVIVMKIGRYANHAGFIVGNSIIHACAKNGRVCKEVFCNKFKNRAIGFFRFKWLANHG